jgi:hypothetical protein
MRRSAAAVLLWLTACAHGPRTGGASAVSDQLQLCVQNETVGYGNIVAHAGMVRFDVMPGQQVCKRVPGPGPMIALQATTTGGGAAGPLSYASRLQVGAGRCWTWRLTESPASAYDLTPCAGEPASGKARADD